MRVIAASLALFALTLVSAGPHDSSSLVRSVHHRRLHSRHFQVEPQPAAPKRRRVRRGCAEPAASASGSPTSNATIAAAPTGLGNSSGLTASVSTCEYGAWQCDGSVLQRCFNSQWNVIQNCTGDNVVCAADSTVTGCVWSWSVPSSSAGSATAAAASSTPTADDYTDCTNETEGSPASSACATVNAALATASPTSTIGGQLFAGASSSTTTTGKGHKQATQTTASPTASPSPAGEAEGISYAASHGLSGASASASSTASAIKGVISSASATLSAGRAGATPSTAVANTTTSGPTGTFSAPHYVIYADEWLNSMPSVSDLGSYNRFILAFWMTNQGAVDDVQFWTQLDSKTRQSVLNEYHAAGIALMISAFGSTDSPTSNGADPVDTANQLAAFVKQWGFDGVDIDYEDMPAMNTNQAEAWIIAFQTQLRQQLPEPYLITHAPVAPWFTSAPDYASGAYVAIHKAVGSMIDFYNVQFYNQGDNVYTDCTSLVTNSGSGWPSTSVMEINSYAGVPLDKIVIGKPLDQNAASNGYMSPSMLNQCVQQAQGLGWNGGVMFWEWTSQAPSVMATVRG